MLLPRAEHLGFPGMLGSIDCCKLRRKNFSTSHHGQYKGNEGLSSITMEANSDDRFYFWHILFGMAGCNNDVTVFNSSTIPGK